MNHPCHRWPSRRELLFAGIFGLAAILRAQSTNDGWGTLRGVVLDGDTDSATACSVTIVDAAGSTVIESKSFAGGFRCDGHFTKLLPPGTTRVRISRGFETRAVERLVNVPTNGEAILEVRLERSVDLRRRGWWGGDSHVHMIHGERTIPVDFDFVALTARAEDLQHLSLAQAWTMENPNPEKLEAELNPRSAPRTVLTWNLEAPKNYLRGDAGQCLGHCWTLGMRGRTPFGEDVIRLLMQSSAHDYESDKPSFANFESHQLIHAQGGTTFYSHPARWWTGAWGGQGGFPQQEKKLISNMAVELPLDTLLGPTFDGIDVMTGAGEFAANTKAFELWCLLLNHGYRVAATASSDSCFDRAGGGTPGVVRTYTHLAGDFSMPAVARATAQGRTFVTSGPLLLASVEGQPPGSAFPADGRTRVLRIEAWASGTDTKGLTRIEILRNGTPVQADIFSPPISSLITNVSLTGTNSAWYCVRVFGGDPRRQQALTGAFFFDAKPHQPPPPIPARVQVALLDASTGARLSGSLTELTFHGPLPQEGPRHAAKDGTALVTIPGNARLRAEVNGYHPLILSPFLDNPALVDFITRLSAEDLLRWETFDRVRQLLGEVRLTFRLEPLRPGTP